MSGRKSETRHLSSKARLIGHIELDHLIQASLAGIIFCEQASNRDEVFAFERLLAIGS